MSENHEILFIQDSSRKQKDARQRLTYYADYLTETGNPWYLPDLNAYRDYLLNERHLMPASVAAHVGTIRVRYRDLLRDKNLPSRIEAHAPAGTDKAALVAEALTRMEQATSTSAGRVEFRRTPQVSHLNCRQINELLAQPNLARRQGLRDITGMGLIISAGVNEAELCALQVSDLFLRHNGVPAIHIAADGKGTERTIQLYDDVYFDMAWLETYLRTYLDVAGITVGPVFRGFFRGGDRMGQKPLTIRGVQKMLKGYVIHDDLGAEMTATALDLRRTYARMLYKAGIPLETIQANLGHTSSLTTLEYIGPPDLSGAPFASRACNGQVLLNKLHQHWDSH
ncbi:MAG: site-specific integrase [Chloroflexi bacterium]|nr:site-specific integrase [Chloroflexota bacterium]